MMGCRSSRVRPGRIFRRVLGIGFLTGVLITAMIAPSYGQDETDALLERFQKMVRANLDNPNVIASKEIDATMRRFSALPLGERVAAWAGWFVDLGKVGYLYGRDPGGYVTDGRICQDFETDCVLFTYRVTELARSTSAEEAAQFAFGTRFYGASIESVVRDDGTVDYDDPAHLEISEEMIESAIWGRNVTAECGTDLSVASAAGGSTGEIEYVPTASVKWSGLQSGDLVWFVGDGVDPAGGSESESESGSGNTVIHHIGLIDRRGGDVDFIHAAIKPLPGEYEKTGAVRVPLKTYLERVDRFKGIAVTRLVEF